LLNQSEGGSKARCSAHRQGEAMAAAHGGPDGALLREMQFLRDDHDFMMRQVARDPLVLRFASDRLKDNYQLVMAALRQNGNAFEFVSERLRTDENVIRAALRSAEAAFADVDGDIGYQNSAAAVLNIMTLIPDEAVRKSIWREPAGRPAPAMALGADEESDSDTETEVSSVTSLGDPFSDTSSDYSSDDED